MPSHSNSRSRWKRCLASLLVLHAAAAPAAPVDVAGLEFVSDGLAPSAGQSLYLEVLLNGMLTHKLVHVSLLGDGHMAMTAASLRSVGLRLDGSAPDRILDLSDVRGLDYRYDRATQSLHLNAAVSMLSATAAQLNASSRERPESAAALPALVLNYDLHGSMLSGGGRSLGALNALRLTGISGVLESSALSRYASDDVAGEDRTVRLDSSWRWSFRDRLAVLNLGDTITGALPWTRATRLGGVQLRRDFALEPDLITFPIPAFRGQAALPSSIELYVDGLRQYSGEITPGPFQLNTAPLINGYGEAQIVVTDMLGRRTTLSFPFYTTGRLLKAGLSDWSAEAGYVRRHYTLRSFDYDNRLAGSGVLRYGLTPWLTLEAHAEGASDLAGGGVGAALGVGLAGVLSASAARSSGLELRGDQYRLGYNWRNRWLSLNVDHLQAGAGYRDLGSLAGPPPLRRSDNATVGVMLGRTGNLSASYLRLDQSDHTSSRYANAFYTLSLGRSASLYASATQNLDKGSDYICQLGVSVAFGGTMYATTSLQRTGHGTGFQGAVTKPVPGDGGTGWSLRGRGGGGDLDSAEADLGWRSGWADLSGGVLKISDHAQGFADVAGAAVLLEQGVFLSRTIDDAFALVSSEGIGGVPVLQENRLIGKTDAAGYYLLPRLNAYQRNHIAIDPMQLSGDLLLTHATQDVVPQERAGALARFDLRRPQAAVLILHDREGRPLPLGSRVATFAGGPPAMIGYDGEVYLEGLQRDNELSVETPAGSVCHVAFDYRAEPGRIPRIGPLPCR